MASPTAADVALTFDDGPGAVTGALLDVLARHGARATFFCVGEQIAGREPDLARAAREGHELGVHGWVHEDHRDDPDRRADEAARTADALAAAAGIRPRLFRPPYGSTSPALEAAIAARGMRTVLWDVDPRDWEDPGVEAIRARTLAALAPGAVVLLHERPDTVAAVDVILGAGWRSVPVTPPG
ncbi:MAG TPA: polysaccharide deacetylase family protein [Solirubrobacteraceae bacterium]|nr:polysaccharide deacetylase family protein [Solirubrobacteraceae bacterium]